RPLPCTWSVIVPRPHAPALFPYTTLFRSTWSRPMVAPVGRSAGRCPGRGVGKEVHSTRRAAATQQTAARALLTRGGVPGGPAGADRKSTRLNSSHVKISYAVFCLKKKKKE